MNNLSIERYKNVSGIVFVLVYPFCKNLNNIYSVEHTVNASPSLGVISIGEYQFQIFRHVSVYTIRPTHREAVDTASSRPPHSAQVIGHLHTGPPTLPAFHQTFHL